MPMEVRRDCGRRQHVTRRTPASGAGSDSGFCCGSGFVSVSGSDSAYGSGSESGPALLVVLHCWPRDRRPPRVPRDSPR
eukprot:1396808-Pyramimonas_sp.AAC.1